MKFLFTVLIFISYSPSLFSQSIEIESDPAQSSFSDNTFSAGDGTVIVSGNQFVLGSAQIANPEAWSFSSSNRRASFLQRSNGINLMSYNAEGDLFIERALQFFTPSDNTINTYQFDNGDIVLRDNVANFTFLNAKGETSYQVSNSSGSTDGEQESQLASNPFGNTIVLYNPVIAYGAETGSRAQIVYGEQDTDLFFNSREDEIRDVRISESGEFITLITTGAGGHTATVYDRFGNELFQQTSDEDLIGATLSTDATHLTTYSSGRVQVYEIPSGNRLGSASSRSSILFAGYDPEAQIIIALGGSQSGMTIEEPEITAVSISEREIAREDVPFSISTLDIGRVALSVRGSNSYSISGLNRDLLMDVVF
ncbi:MAG: hypothetical protein RI575_04310 [Balneolaceae bacterium]|nr:hypothetical protein [Balneolaceae bacterium]